MSFSHGGHYPPYQSYFYCLDFGVHYSPTWQIFIIQLLSLRLGINIRSWAVVIVSATASLQAVLRSVFERLAAGRAGASTRSTNHPNKSLGLAPKNRSAAVVCSDIFEECAN
jgi:hypothetical protein